MKRLILNGGALLLAGLLAGLLASCGSDAALTVTATDPPATAKGVAVAAPLTVTFSRTLDPTAITADCFTLAGPDGRVSGRIMASGNVLSFIPTAPLAAATDYTARIVATLRDRAGNFLAADYVWSFNTGVKLAIGQGHTCELLDDGQVKCWGDNDTGQLGLGDTNAYVGGNGGNGGFMAPVDLGSGRRALTLVAGADHTCARLDDGRVKCWGDNAFGQLGLGSTQDRGDDPNEMGDHLPAVAFGAGRTVLELVAGSFHSCVRLDDGRVKCWGDNSSGQLGLGDSENRGDGPNEMGDSLPAVNLGSGRKAVALWAGPYHTCARLDNRQVKCWGDNSAGQLGLGDTENRGDNPGEMGDFLPPVTQ